MSQALAFIAPIRAAIRSAIAAESKPKYFKASGTALILIGIAIAGTVYFIQEPQVFDEMRNQIRMTLKI